MLEILSLGFPFSYLTLAISFLVGIGVTLLTVGLFSLILLLFLSYTGVIRILPFYSFIQKIIVFLFPEFISKVKNSIQDTFILEGIGSHDIEKKDQSIYMFHPHGAFSTSYFFHIQKNKSFGKGVISKYLWCIPFSWEIYEHLRFIPNTFSCMKEVLVEKKENLSIIPGGSLEMLEIKEQKSKTLRIKLLNRKGIFRLALETGVQLVPCLTFGETELYSLYEPPKFIREFLKQFEIILPLPSLASFKTWYNLLTKGSDTPIKTYIGEPLKVEKIEKPTQEDIIKLRTNYINHLQDLYKKVKPKEYSDSLEIV